MFKVNNNVSVKKHFNKANGFENAAFREIRHQLSNYDAECLRLRNAEGFNGPEFQENVNKWADELKAQVGKNQRAVAAIDAWLNAK